MPVSAAAFDPAQVPAAMRQPTPSRAARSSVERRFDREAQREAGARLIRAAFRRVRADGADPGVFHVESLSEYRPRPVNLEPGHAQRCDCPDAELQGMPCLHYLSARLFRGDDPREVARDAYAEARAELVRRDEAVDPAAAPKRRARLRPISRAKAEAMADVVGAQAATFRDVQQAVRDYMQAVSRGEAVAVSWTITAEAGR